MRIYRVADEIEGLDPSVVGREQLSQDAKDVIGSGEMLGAADEINKVLQTLFVLKTLADQSKDAANIVRSLKVAETNLNLEFNNDTLYDQIIEQNRSKIDGLLRNTHFSTITETLIKRLKEPNVDLTSLQQSFREIQINMKSGQINKEQSSFVDLLMANPSSILGYI